MSGVSDEHRGDLPRHYGWGCAAPPTAARRREIRQGGKRSTELRTLQTNYAAQSDIGWGQDFQKEGEGA